MIHHFRFLLWPFSLIYAFIINVRNWLFDINILTSERFDIPIVSVGNLKVGGTSKTPFVIYLFEIFEQTRSIAVLSRGYGRKTKGFYEVKLSSYVKETGDEPMLIKYKCSSSKVFVDENRCRGIRKISNIYKYIDLIVLDDAFQHRYVNPDVNILLTVYDDLYVDDAVLPYGRLREPVCGAQRADIVVVTKCPWTLSVDESKSIKERLDSSGKKKVFFSKTEYGEPYEVYSKEKFKDDENGALVLISGVSNNKVFFDEIRSRYKVSNEFSFKDHMNYDESVLLEIFNVVDSGQAIMTTEKDSVKLSYFKEQFDKYNIRVYVMPIKMKIMFNEEKVLKELILDKINNI